MFFVWMFVSLLCCYLFSVHHVERAKKLISEHRVYRVKKYKEMEKALKEEREHVKLLVRCMK